MSGSKSRSRSGSTGRNQTFIDPSQAPFLEFLRTQGQGLAQGQMGAGSDFQTGVVDPTMQAFGQALRGNTQFQYQQNPYLSGQIEQGQQLINRNLQENVLPSIGSQSQMVNQRGGSRQGIAEGIAARSAIEQQSDFAQNLIGADFERQQQLGAQQRMQAMSMAPMMAGLQFSPLSNLAQLIGRPTVLSEGTASSRGRSKSKGLGF